MENQYRAYVGKNASYYLNQFSAMRKQSGLVLSWNWGAFFFGGTWALYRKMYGWFGLWLLVLYSVLVAQHFVSGPVGLVLLVGAFVLSGFTANALYYKQANSALASAQFSYQDPQKQIENLAQRGGVLRWLPWVGYGALALTVVGILAAVIIPQIRHAEQKHLSADNPSAKYAQSGKNPITNNSAESDLLKDQAIDGKAVLERIGLNKPQREIDHEAYKQTMQSAGVGGTQSVDDIAAWANSIMQQRSIPWPSHNRIHAAAAQWQVQLAAKVNMPTELGLFHAYSYVLEEYQSQGLICAPNIAQGDGVKFISKENDEVKFEYSPICS